MSESDGRYRVVLSGERGETMPTFTDHSIEIAELRARLDEAYTVYENMEERIDELRARLAELEKKAGEKP